MRREPLLLRGPKTPSSADRHAFPGKNGRVSPVHRRKITLSESVCSTRPFILYGNSCYTRSPRLTRRPCTRPECLSPLPSLPFRTEEANRVPSSAQPIKSILLESYGGQMPKLLTARPGSWGHGGELSVYRQSTAVSADVTQACEGVAAPGGPFGKATREARKPWPTPLPRLPGKMGSLFTGSRSSAATQALRHPEFPRGMRLAPRSSPAGHVRPHRRQGMGTGPTAHRGETRDT